MSNKQGKRMTFKRVRPNPLFEGWLEELYEEAKAKKSKLEPMIKQALDSISKYPLPLETGADCMILKGFKKKLCMHLDHRLEVHKYNLLTESKRDIFRKLRSSAILMSFNNDSSNQSGALQNSSSDNTQGVQSNAVSNSNDPAISVTAFSTEAPVTSTSGTKKQSRGRKYIPAYRSGAYAILIALLEDSIENPGNCLSKQEVIDRAQKHSEESFIRPKPDTFYTAWSNMSNLIAKSLVKKARNKTVKYQLTDQGLELAKQVQAKYQKRPTVNDFIFNGGSVSVERSGPHTKVTQTKRNERNNTPSSGSSTAEQNDVLKTIGNVLESNKISKTVVHVDVDEPSPTKIAKRNNGLRASSVQEQKEHSPSTSNSQVCPLTSQENNVNSKLMNDKSPNLSEIVHLPAGSFDIILLIDKNETGGLSKKNDPTVVQFKKYPDLNHEYRSLKVGDFTWIARHKVHKDQELVLPFIVERKRMDDLAASIKDGRFHEQKFRLRKCSMKVVYLVENYGSNKHVGLPMQNLMQALANTRIQDKFKIHVTDSLTHTARFLAMLTKRLTIRYGNNDLKGQNGEQKDFLMTFDYFNKTSAKSKSLTVKATFIKLLLQIKGVSVEKALAITATYSTPRSLIVAYQKCDQSTGESLLAHLKYEDLGRNVGPAVSRAIYQVFATVWMPLPYLE